MGSRGFRWGLRFVIMSSDRSQLENLDPVQPPVVVLDCGCQVFMPKYRRFDFLTPEVSGLKREFRNLLGIRRCDEHKRPAPRGDINSPFRIMQKACVKLMLRRKELREAQTIIAAQMRPGVSTEAFDAMAMAVRAIDDLLGKNAQSPVR